MRWTGIALSISFAAGSAFAQPSLVIDDFDFVVNDEAGGAREMSLAVLSNPFSQLTKFDVVPGFSFGGVTGALVFNAGLGVLQTGTVSWGVGGPGLSLNAASLAGFELDFLHVDQDFQMSIEISTFDTSGSAVWNGGVLGSAVSQTVTVNFADFAPGTAGGFDPGNLDSITMRFNTAPSPTSSLDFVLTEFRATNVIPAPGSAALLGVAGVFASRRRRR